MLPVQAIAIDRALEQGLKPHRALYDIQLSKNKNGSQIVNISGQMMYEWKPSCDAWVSNHRFNMVYEYADGPAMQISSDFVTYESFDGKTINFTSQRKRDGQLFEELRGSAEMSEGGPASEAVFNLPKGLTFDLPKGTLFPMGHTLSVLENIKKGKKFYSATIFDGGDEDGPVEVNSFIGKPIDPASVIKTDKDIDKSLLDSKAWEVRLAFFPLKNSESTADYEISLVFQENGVVSDMKIDYADFSVNQKLVALEPLEGGCNAKSDEEKKGDKPDVQEH
ncbi:MAG: cell envelope integrity EipB family protein [Alphaproteobacteria bacterium]|nr:cell envelope integrity EipB family protein [Alphaproteobacteria bacterium]